MTDRDMSYGEHARFVREVGEFRVQLTPGPQIELVASFLPDPAIPSPGHLPATTLAIHMGPEVAASLFSLLRETFHSMDLPLPREDETPDGRQRVVTDGPHSSPKHTSERRSAFPREISVDLPSPNKPQK